MRVLLARLLCASMALLIPLPVVRANPQERARAASSPQAVPLAQFMSAIREKAKGLESSSGMRLAFRSFLASRHLSPDSVRYSDFVIIRLLYEATRDAGFWNMHWSITDQPPNSDRIWSQWKAVLRPSPSEPTAIAECDELSALYAFLVERSGVKSVGLFWPTANHTVAVWVLKPASGPVVRVVVPTSQIFLEETDSFDTRKFDPWRQKTIYEYTRRDAPDTLELPKPLVDFFLKQVDIYGGASDATLQRLRYVRDAVFVRTWTTEQAARDAQNRRAALAAGSTEDAFALQNFAADMRLEPLRH
jgi:hypothetical protein